MKHSLKILISIFCILISYSTFAEQKVYELGTGQWKGYHREMKELQNGRWVINPDAQWEKVSRK